jgi:hypothetical protein
MTLKLGKYPTRVTTLTRVVLLLIGLQSTLPQDHGCYPAPLLRGAWSTLVPSAAGSTGQEGLIRMGWRVPPPLFPPEKGYFFLDLLMLSFFTF